MTRNNQTTGGQGSGKNPDITTDGTRGMPTGAADLPFRRMTTPCPNCGAHKPTFGLCPACGH